MEKEKLLTSAEMAGLMGYSMSGFYNLPVGEKPPAIKRHGRSWRYRYSDYIDWLDQQAAKSGIRVLK